MLKRIILSLVALAGWACAQTTLPLMGVGGAATFSELQHPLKASCADATTCSVTLTQSLAANSLMTIQAWSQNNVTISSINVGGTAIPLVDTNVTCTGCGSGSAATIASAYAYPTSATAGPVVVTFSATTGGTQVEIREFSISSGGAYLDATGKTFGAVSGAYNGQALTLQGTQDIDVQMSGTNYDIINAVDSPYGSFDSDGTQGTGYARRINTSSGTAPVWHTNGAGSGNAAVSGMAFAIGSSGCLQNYVFDGSGGSNGNAPTTTDLQTSTHGIARGNDGITYTVTNGSSAITYDTAAHNVLLNYPTLCLGGTYSDSSTVGLSYNTSNGANQFLKAVFPANVPNTVTAGVWFKTSIPQNAASFQTDAFWIQAVATDFMNMAFSGNGTNLRIRGEGFNSSAGCTLSDISLSTTTLYWLTIQYGTAGVGHIARVYQSDGVTQVGSDQTCPGTGTHLAGNVLMGDGLSSALPAAQTIYWDSLKVCYGGTCSYPLLP